jgi:Na+/H+-dicarboxylate symporter
MMAAIFAALLAAFVSSWLGRERLAAALFVSTFALAVGLFLYEIYSPEYGFRMPWIQTQLERIPGSAAALSA